MTVTCHISMSIEGLEREFSEKRSYSSKNRYAKDLFGHTYGSLVRSLEHMKSKGMLYIPSQDCNNRLPDGSCGCFRKHLEETEKKKELSTTSPT